jgi:putative N6-adenine-specific DNA methylase
LLDPLCGSGTIPIEAAMVARGIPPGLGRGFAFQRWPGFDERAWGAVLDSARQRILPASLVQLLGSDRDPGAVENAAANAARAGVGGDVEWRRAAVSAIEPPPGPGWVVTNPPYGVRVGDRTRLRDLYAQIGNVLRAKCPGWEVAMLTAHAALEGQTRLGLEPRFSTQNGGLRVRLMRARVG